MQNPGILILVLSGIIFSSCRKTPSSNYLPKPLGEDMYAPWDAPQYTYEQLLSYFPDEDYTTIPTQIYVAKTGNDSSGDGSMTSPYLTIQHAIDQHQNPGTVINVGAGTYNENVNIDVEASLIAPYVLYSYEGPGQAIIDAQMKGDQVVQLGGKYNILDGFEVKNGGRYCVLITSSIPVGENPFGGGDCYSVLRNNIVHTAVQDVVKCGHLNFVLIEKNDVSVSLHEVQNDQCIDGVGVYHSICQYNYLHDNGDGGGGYFKGGSTNNFWVFNLIADMQLSGLPEYSAFGLQLGGSGQFSYRDQAWTEYPAGHKQIIHSNVFMNCDGCAVTAISAWDCRIYNNTIYNCGYSNATDPSRNAIFRATVSSGNTDNGVRSQGLEIKNNISYNDASHPVVNYFTQLNTEHGAVTNSNNCFFNSNGGQTWTIPGGASATNIISDPLFTDADNCDFSLTVGSPCIDEGVNLGSVTRGISMMTCSSVLSTISRPQSIKTDMGAYEQ